MRKGQFSIDYMSTYSLALFAFLAVMLTIVYVYVQPEMFVREECRVLDTFNCEDALIQEGEISVVLRNNLPDNLNVTRFECFHEEENNVSNDNIFIESNGIQELNCNLANLANGRKVNVGYSISYLVEDKSFISSTTGTVVTTNRIS